MIGLWVLYGLAAIVGIATPVVLRLRERRLPDDEVRRALSDLDRSPAALGMLAGGPARMVDAIVTDLVGRGVVTADAGRLSSRQEDATGLTTREIAVIGAVKEVGAEGIGAVRDAAARIGFVFEGTLRSLGPLVISPLRRTWGPAGTALATLGVIALASFGMIVADSRSIATALAIGGWVPITVLVAVLTSRRTGCSGPDPRSALGVACTDLALQEVPRGAPQWHRVALGGFEAMTDAALRTAIQGEAGSGAWPPRARRPAHPIDRLAADIVRPAQAD